MRNIEIKNLKYLILLILFPVLVFSILTVSKFVFEPHDLVPAGFRSNLRVLKVGDNVIKVEVASTPEERAKGLSGRSGLPRNQGMIFVFPQIDRYYFWMKDMQFSLDFVWMRGNKVVEMTLGVKPEDYQPPKTIIPKEKIDKVLELSAGTAERLNIKVGDAVAF